MAEFILDTSGHVGGQRREAADGSWVIAPFNMRWCDLDAFTQGYIEALFFTSVDAWDEAGQEAYIAAGGEDSWRGEPKGFSDIAPEALTVILKDCAVFQSTAGRLGDFKWLSDLGYGVTKAGRDFWYTRNGCGTGFWDRGLGRYGDRFTKDAKAFREVDAYLGDDGKVYLS